MRSAGGTDAAPGAFAGLILIAALIAWYAVERRQAIVPAALR